MTLRQIPLPRPGPPQNTSCYAITVFTPPPHNGIKKWDWQSFYCCFKINYTLIRMHHSPKVNFIYCVPSCKLPVRNLFSELCLLTVAPKEYRWTAHWTQHGQGIKAQLDLSTVHRFCPHTAKRVRGLSLEAVVWLMGTINCMYWFVSKKLHGGGVGIRLNIILHFWPHLPRAQLIGPLWAADLSRANRNTSHLATSPGQTAILWIFLSWN